TISMALIEVLIHFLTATNYELHRDEMLYFSMGSHPDWGFASTPPFISILSFIIKHLFGYHEFFLKLFPALAGASIIVLIAMFIKELGGKNTAVFTGCFAFLVSTAMLRSTSLFMPVIFELFFWMLFLFFVLKLINTQKPGYWLWIGISFGLAFLNKYSVLILGGATFISILISRHRKLLLSVHVIYAVLAALVIMSPNIIWQITHNMAVATHMKELYRTQLVYMSPGTFIYEQFMMNFPAVFIWMAGLAGIIFIKAEARMRVFGFIFVSVLVLFLVAKGKAYYTLGVYSMMFAFGGYIIEKYMRKWFVSVIVFSFVMSLLLLPFGLPVLKQENLRIYCKWFSEYVTPEPMRTENNTYSPIPQDYTDMTGWNKLAKLASEAYNELDAQEKKNCTIFANNYGQAGALDFYGKRYNLPSPVCLNDSYIFWAPDSLTSRVFIVSDNQIGDIPELFNSYRETGRVVNDCFRENGLRVYLCKDPKPLLMEFFRKRIKENKKTYGY
ncbi:MAG TPA: glycosyltransferase family 39 protein, partial [Bacteroidales bacterium]|nr:glycosyltransferase family 39 protein [Bacteroidales bacterium]